MQTILGAGGAIANEIAKALPNYTDNVQLVSRHPKTVLGNEKLFVADLLNAGQTTAAIAGSDIVYFAAGLPYKAGIWEKQWPIIMQNTINACKENRAKLVFFDNIYMYGNSEGWKKETTSFNAVSRKGKVRAKIATMLLEEMQAGNLEALIARAPSFYGFTKLAFTSSVVFEKLAAGKKANWLISDQTKNTFIYIPDAGSATALLGNTPDVWQQTWHLPTNKNAITGKEFITMAANALGVDPNYTVLKKWMIQLAGLFNPYIKEVIEMLYEYEQDYLFSSEKFENRFPEFQITGYEEGIKAIAAQYKNKSTNSLMGSK